MGVYGNKAKFVVSKANPKRQKAKARRKFGQLFIGSDKKEVIDAFCQSKDPLFKEKGQRRTNLMKSYR